eukprot:TRINITY_DN14676_c0_g1_i14.p2 TRINITY_DN14676_c0_g1~~TRINITY_DN14676_c0_g1_i14.p2  ORF type:complete len:214 (-),score=1.67 TRINITY_DN14676_c0_g1_i14:993-1607(-)
MQFKRQRLERFLQHTKGAEWKWKGVRYTKLIGTYYMPSKELRSKQHSAIFGEPNKTQYQPGTIPHKQQSNNPAQAVAEKQSQFHTKEHAFIQSSPMFGVSNNQDLLPTLLPRDARYVDCFIQYTILSGYIFMLQCSQFIDVAFQNRKNHPRGNYLSLATILTQEQKQVGQLLKSQNHSIVIFIFCLLSSPPSLRFKIYQGMSEQ